MKLSIAISTSTNSKKNCDKLYKSLRHKNKKYHHRSNDYCSRGTIIDRVMIDKRPKIVEKKSRMGDWEIATVVGKNHKGFLVTAVLIEMITPLKKITHTITSDNGKEFADHKEVSAVLGTNFYFANPYHSWERGVNEYTNGLIRQYLPKKSEFLMSISKRLLLRCPENYSIRKLHMKYFLVK